MTRSVSRARLGRLSRHLDAYVAAKKIPCAMCLVTMHGDEAYYHESGLCDVERNVEVSRDTIFRIYSMTKPITSVALMMLYEEGHFQLDDPVAEYIPSWGRLRVYQSGKGESIATREAVNAMTVKNLLTHTSGLTYGFMQSHPVDAVYRSERIGGGPGRTLQDTVDALAATPLLYDPGTRWHYSVSTDICGYLVQLFSGQDLDDFIHDRICRPLGMADTAFRVPEATRHRLAACYSHSDSGYRLQDDPIKSTYFERPTFLSGGGGMVSTVDDYTRFALMLLNKGILDGERVLGSKTVEYMTTNHLPKNVDLAAMGQSVFSETPFAGIGFGLGFSVVIDPPTANVLDSPGEFAWGGAASTYFWVDPIEQITVVFMTQLLPSSTWPIRRELKTLVYQAIEE